MPGDLDTFFDEQAEGLCHTDYWARLAAIWRSSDAEARRDERWRSIFAQARLAPGSQSGLMTADEQELLAGLPETVGLRPAGDDVAFARRLAGDGADAHGTVARHRIVALFVVGGEPEAILEPDRA